MMIRVFARRGPSIRIGEVKFPVNILNRLDIRKVPCTDTTTSSPKRLSPNILFCHVAYSIPLFDFTHLNVDLNSAEYNNHYYYIKL